MKIFMSLCTIFLLTITLNATTIETITTDPIGTWKTLVKDVPDMGDLKGTMKITKDGDTYKVMLASDAGEAELQKIVLKDNKLTGEINLQGVALKLIGSFDDDKFSGRWKSEYGIFNVTAEKE